MLAEATLLAKRYADITSQIDRKRHLLIGVATKAAGLGGKKMSPAARDNGYT